MYIISNHLKWCYIWKTCCCIAWFSYVLLKETNVNPVELLFFSIWGTLTHPHMSIQPGWDHHFLLISQDVAAFFTIFIIFTIRFPWQSNTSSGFHIHISMRFPNIESQHLPMRHICTIVPRLVQSPPLLETWQLSLIYSHSATIVVGSFNAGRIPIWHTPFNKQFQQWKIQLSHLKILVGE